MTYQGLVCWSCYYLEEKNLSLELEAQTRSPNVPLSSDLMEDYIWRNLLTSALKDSWKNELFTDLEICVDNGSLKAHKVVLASVSPYFRALLSVDLEERHSSIVKLKGFNLETLEATLDYVYCGCITLSEDNAADVLALADYFQIHTLKKLCCTFFKRHATPLNCLAIYELATLHLCHDLADFLMDLASDSCSEVLFSPNVLSIQPETLLCILKQPVLQIDSEDELFQTIVKWYSFDEEGRIKWLPKMLAQIKGAQLGPGYKIRMKEYFEEICLMDPGVNVSAMLACNEFRHRKVEELLMVFGGEGKGPVYNHCECFAIGYSGWKCSIPATGDSKKDLNRKEGEQVIPSMVHPRSYAAVAFYNNSIYILGGLNSRSFLNVCECYNIAENKWRPVLPLPDFFHGAGASFLQRDLYIAGGKDSSSFRDHLLVLDSNKWKPKCKMLTARAHFGLVSLDGYLYAIGGLTGSKTDKMYAKTLSSCERYDPLTDSWIPIASLSCPRAYLGVALVGENLYAIGGYDGDYWLNIVEKYEPLKDNWVTVRPMVCPRSSFGVTVSHGRIYCIGGFGGKTVLNTAEKYNPRTDMWHCVQSMQFKRMGLSAATIRMPTDEVVLKKKFSSNPGMICGYQPPND